MTAQEMIQQAREEANDCGLDRAGRLVYENALLRDIIRHLCDPENVPYPMTSPEL
jgi:hypothetical protein